MKRYYLFSLFFILLIFTGCTTQKKLAYFNKIDENASDTINSKMVFKNQAIISSGDRIGISVSAEDPLTVVTYNLPFVSFANPTSDNLQQSISLQTYLVDIYGYINFPQIGKIKVVGLTRKKLVSLITEKLEPYVKSPIVNVQFFDFTVTVLGEVARPGKYPLTNEQTTLLDALGMAGDLTPYGKRNNILVSREVNGEIKFARINLNSAQLFTSDYYYVKQNDVIIIEPNSVRSISSQNIPLFLSTISTLATTVTLIFTITRSVK